ncbi:MAG: hypothetical protein ACUVVU_05545, partial [Tepidimonas sp.]|uniref:hypothetical protein n=1 Tax=Tepidimonas sp. TaxID=2002775 RepID=UPI004054CD25
HCAPYSPAVPRPACRGLQQPPVALHMLSCEAAGHTLAVAAVRLPDTGSAGEGPAGWIDDWQRASWATLQLAPGPHGVPPGLPVDARDTYFGGLVLR